jgi:hypothetical protein
MAEITRGRHAIAHSLLEFPKLRKAPFLAPIEEHLPVEPQDENSLGLAWDQRNLREVRLEGRE